jgi:hypothetical protein
MGWVLVMVGVGRALTRALALTLSLVREREDKIRGRENKIKGAEEREMSFG